MYVLKLPTFDQWLLTIWSFWPNQGRSLTTAQFWKVDGSPTLGGFLLTLSMNAGFIGEMRVKGLGMTPVGCGVGIDWRLHADGLKWAGRQSPSTGDQLADFFILDHAIGRCVTKLGDTYGDRALGRMWLPPCGDDGLDEGSGVAASYHNAHVLFCDAIIAGGGQNGMTFRPIVWRPSDGTWDYQTGYRLADRWGVIRKRRRWRLGDTRNRIPPFSQWNFNGVPQ